MESKDHDCPVHYYGPHVHSQTLMQSHSMVTSKESKGEQTSKMVIEKFGWGPIIAVGAQRKVKEGFLEQYLQTFDDISLSVWNMGVALPSMCIDACINV